MGHSQPAKHSTTSAKSEVAEREKQREKHAVVSPLASAERAYAQLFELLVSPSLHKSEQRINGTWGLRPQLGNSDELDCETPASERLH
jgi:hypothetical protein